MSVTEKDNVDSIKVWELEECKEYVQKYGANIFKVVDGVLLSKSFEKCGYEIFHAPYNDVIKYDFTEYIPPTDWSKVEVDTKVLVRDNENDDWIKRYFAKYENGYVYTWRFGATSYSTPDKTDMAPYKYGRLYNDCKSFDGLC